MFLARIPRFVTWMWPRRLWRMSPKEKVLYLTFDDGPFPGITEQVLDMLDRFEAKATFFVVGEQVQKHPELLRELPSRGHQVGNHSHTHPNGFHTASGAYLADVWKGQKVISQELGRAAHLFRPPYGRIRSKDAKKLVGTFRLVMWDVLAGDWVDEISPKRALENVLHNARNGSIVVFHDSPKCVAKMLPALKATLEHFSQLGFRFKALP